MNRHHFAVFVHNCHLVLLMRQEPGHGVDLNTFKPAEWRWKLTQICDGDWHHYAVSVDFPQVPGGRATMHIRIHIQTSY